MTAILAVAAALFAAAGLLAIRRLRAADREIRRLRDTIRTRDRESDATRDQIARAENAKRRFLASVTHELRTPLTAIMGYQELLADGLYGTLQPRAREPIARIGLAARQLLHLVDGVLELARLESGTLELNLGPVAIDQALARAADHARSLAAETRTAIDTDFAVPLPGITTDPDRLAQILDLAIDAAVRASPGARLRLSARPADDGAIDIQVAGTGLAIDRYSPERIFGEFEHAPDGSGDSVRARTGLRLSIALRLARLLGGDLALLPADSGTTLRLRILPAATVPHDSTRPASPPD